MRILITGCTGTAGSAAVRQAIADPCVTGITALTRRPIPVAHPKLTVVDVADFRDLSSISAQLAGHDAALWCLGTSQNRVDRATLHKITVDYVVAGAKALKEANPSIRFCHLSGAGADPSGKARMAFAKEKGMAEAALDKLDLAGLWHFRPGYIHPPQPVEKPLLQDKLMWRLAPLMRLVARNSMVDADVLARAMLHVAALGHERRVLDNKAILVAAN